MRGGDLGLQWGWENHIRLSPVAEGTLTPHFPLPGPGVQDGAAGAGPGCLAGAGAGLGL